MGEEPQSVQDPNHSRFRRLAAICGVYLVAYSIVSYADIYTTVLALQQPGTVEGNVCANGTEGYSIQAAWVITIVGAVCIIGCLIWSLVKARYVSARCLDHPIRSFSKLYIIPFSRRILDRSPLHMLSFVIAFLLIKLLAVGNNWMIHETGTGPLGWLIGMVSNYTTPTLGFWLVLAPLFYLLAIVLSPLAANLIRWFQQRSTGEQVSPAIS